MNGLKDVKGKKKGISTNVSGKRKTKQNEVLLLNESGALATKNWDTG